MANPILNPLNGAGAKVFDNNYLDEHKTELIGQIVLEGKTAQWAHVIPGVKNRISLNGIGEITDVADASCGWNNTGDINLTQRELIVYPKEIKNEICPKTLEMTYLGAYMKTNKEIPFVGVIADQYVKTANAFSEKMVWQGDGSNDGIYQILNSDANVVDASTAVNSAATWIARVNAMLAATPAEVLEREDGVLVMSYTDFMAYQQELVAANLYHYDANAAQDMSFFVPGTNIKVRATAGMNGIAAPTKGKNMILTYEDNVIVGTDMLDNEEVFDIFYSRDNDVVRVNVQFKIGGNVYFPQFAVKGYAI